MKKVHLRGVGPSAMLRNRQFLVVKQTIATEMSLDCAECLELFEQITVQHSVCSNDVEYITYIDNEHRPLHFHKMAG